ncbi:unnamed protein product [Brugia pahangi]|uniref:Tudor domain-containing protein n=1 Tax=Brugia pahangi TaxID=6280 RepID=A0A0N4TRF0_BRUPA|nr:unnamed protein product [Brugia pahangi]
MDGINLDGFIYDCSPNGIRSIYCSVIGEVCLDETTEVISRSRKPNIGMWCKFKPFCQENGKWFARKIVLMAHPRLKCLIRENECIVKGTAVVCNVSDCSGYLWNDYIGLIAVEGQMVNQLKPLTAVEFQALPLRKSGTSVYFMAKEISVESESVFQSEVLIFTQKAEVKADGRVYVSDCAITLLDIAYSAEPIIGTTISILYYRAYNDYASGIGIYATTDSNTVAGIRDDFFTTKRCFELCAECTEVEQFSNACEDLNTVSDQSLVIDDEIPTIKIDISGSPIRNITEFAESNENNHSTNASKMLVSLSNDSNCSMNQNFQPLNSIVLDNELNSSDKFPLNSFAEKSGRELASSSKDSVAVEPKNEFMRSKRDGLESEDVWDDEFVEHLTHKLKEMKEIQDENDGKYNDVIDQYQNDIASAKEEFRDKLKDHAMEECDSLLHVQNIETKDIGTWINEMDKLCIKVLSNARLRNFVSVNENGNALLRDIMYYLNYQITMDEINEELGIPLSEVTPECFNIVHEERALAICRKLMKMNGFERIANSKIPEIPAEMG